MKVVIFIAHMSLGGTQRVCYNLTRWLLDNKKAEVYIAICSDRTTGAFIYNLVDIPHNYLPSGTAARILALRNMLKEQKPDILLTLGVTETIISVPACIGLNIKHVVSERNDPSHFAGKALTRIISRKFLKMADGYVFQTRDAQAFYGGKIAQASMIIPNPLFNVEKLPQTAYSGADTKTIVTAGRLNKQKNHKLLINAFSRFLKYYPEYSLVIYGEGPERGNLELLIKKLQLENYIFLPGAVNNISEKIFNASLFVLSSDFEGMPNALIEAMALGLPCISTDCPCGGPRELISDKNNGLLTPVNNVDRLTDVMLCIVGDKELQSKLRINAFKIREKLSMEKICEKWFLYFVQLIK